MASTRGPSVLVVASVFIVAVSAVVLAVFGGWTYYRAPLGTRGYLPAHQWLRPSGALGLSLGIAGALSMMATLPYAVRKYWRPLAKAGSLGRWLNVHIFFGIVGPMLVTLHTSFKFNGLISVGYWLMMTVWASGFVGRYLYVRIPKSIRGVELTRDEISADLERARERLTQAPLPDTLRREIARLDAPGSRLPAWDLFTGEIRVRIRVALLRRHFRQSGIDAELVHETVALATERAWLSRRIAHLQRTRRLFDLWHVFHRPLVYALFVIVALHVTVAVYLGYVSFGSEAS